MPYKGGGRHVREAELKALKEVCRMREVVAI